MLNPEQLGGEVPEEYRGNEAEVPKEKEASEEKEEGPLTNEEIEELQLLEGPDMFNDRESYILFHEWVKSNVSVQDKRVMIRRLKELQDRRNEEMRHMVGPRLEDTSGPEEYFREIAEAKQRWEGLSSDEREGILPRLKRLNEKGTFDFEGKKRSGIGVGELSDYLTILSSTKKRIPESEWK